MMMIELLYSEFTSRPAPPIYRDGILTADARFRGEISTRMKWGALILAMSTVPAVLLLAAGEGGVVAAAAAIGTLITASVGAWALLKKVTSAERRAVLAERKAEMAEREEHAATRTRLELISMRYEELEKRHEKLDKRLTDQAAEHRHERDIRDERIRALETTSRDQTSRLSTMQSIINEMGIVIREDGIKSARLETIWAQYELIQRRSHISNDNTP